MHSPTSSRYQPLAERLRPKRLEDFIGQTHLLGKNRVLSRMLQAKTLYSLIFWGPPGVGKTTLAHLLAQQSNLHFIRLSAVLDGVKAVRSAVESAQKQRDQFGQGTLLFVDEVHRFNKAQQDAFLPFVEDGTFIFIGATTENPSFELNNALLSRAKVLVLTPLDEAELQQVLAQGLAKLAEDFTSNHRADDSLSSSVPPVQIEPAAAQALIAASDGDARRLLNFLEQAMDFVVWPESFTQAATLELLAVKEVIQGGLRRFDKGGEAFYDQISALHKSVRGSDPNAALYWLLRMLDGGVDPRYLARRLIRMASEEIGNADPKALQVTVDAAQAYERLGSPEGDLALAQAATYLAVAPKSNAVYMAYKLAIKEIKEQGSYEVPLHLRNAPTELMNQLDYGKDYRYAHDEPEAFAAGECYFPEEMAQRNYYQPVERGLEIKISAKMRHLETLNQQARNKRRR
ncbi:MAG: replication-associated recombination protein A [Thiotrichales bacterium]|nr:replication-associated recombination protein A [Thiotrichales bacterium]